MQSRLRITNRSFRHTTRLHLSCGTNFLIPFRSFISLVHLSASVCPQAPTLKCLLSTCLVVCSILGSRPISFPSLFLLSSPLSHGLLSWKINRHVLVVFGVVNLIKIKLASFWMHYNIPHLATYYLRIIWSWRHFSSLLLAIYPHQNVTVRPLRTSVPIITLLYNVSCES